MRNKIIFFILLFLSLRVDADITAPFEKVVCPDVKTLAKELLESELSGQRFYAATDACRNEKKSTHFRTASAVFGENPEDIKFLRANEKSPFEILKISEMDGGIVQVEFSWRVLDEKNPKKTKTISDVLKFAAYKGKMKDVVGCAGVLFAPEHIVVRQSCINSEKIKK